MESTDAPGEKAVTEEEVKELMENQVRCLLCLQSLFVYSHVCMCALQYTLKVVYINGYIPSVAILLFYTSTCKGYKF